MTRVRRHPAALAGALALCALPALGGSARAQEPAARARVAAPREVAVDEARTALRRSLAWLVEHQHEDGSWAEHVPNGLQDFGFGWQAYYAWKQSASALACMALLAAPETPERRAALERGLEWLCTSRIAVRADDWDVDSNWAHLYGLVALVEAAGDPRFAGEEWSGKLRARGVRFWSELAKTQTLEGGWAYYDDPPWTERPTWATSFCTALVLPALERARTELGWPVPERALQRAVQAVRRCALPNGAYTYSVETLARPLRVGDIDQVKGSLGRIQVCNWALAECGVPWVTPERVEEGLEAFFEHHRFLAVARLEPVPHNSYYYNSGYFYFFGHYYAAQAIELLPRERREAWHRRLRAKVVGTLRADGACSDFLSSSYMVVASTSYAALTLTLGLPEHEERR